VHRDAEEGNAGSINSGDTNGASLRLSNGKQQRHVEDDGRGVLEAAGTDGAECKAMGRDLDGMCIYIKARDELAEEARKLLTESAAKELKGEEGEKLMQAFRDEAEAAEAGMGAMFG